MIKIEDGGNGIFYINDIPYQKGEYELKLNGEKISIVRVSEGVISDSNLAAQTDLSEWVDADDNPFATLTDFINYISGFFLLTELNTLTRTAAQAVKIQVSGKITYIGKAAPGADQADPVWQAQRIDESGAQLTIVTWADGGNFTQVATDLSLLTYL